jgi:hypothetical protein
MTQMSTILKFEKQGTWANRKATGELANGIELASFETGSQRGVALLLAADIKAWVNGYRIWGGLQILQHRDEIVLADQSRFLYSQETQPQVSVYEPGDGSPAVKCVICRTAFKARDPIVRCPQCGRIYHQSENKPCWTYRTECGVCGHPTAMDCSNLWRPDETL